MHYQKTPFSETKIIHCISGEIYDVAIDLRKNLQHIQRALHISFVKAMEK